MGSIEQVWEPQLGLFYSTALKAFDIFGLGIQIQIQCLKINPVPDHFVEPILARWASIAARMSIQGVLLWLDISYRIFFFNVPTLTREKLYRF